VDHPLDDGVSALDAGQAYVELDDHRVTAIAGRDARGWLHDLVTTDVGSLAPGEARPSLLLTPTGRIRAVFHVMCLEEDVLLLVQRDDQGQAVRDALGPYVLSAAVEVSPSAARVFALPGAAPPSIGGGRRSRPSVLGGGVDVIADDGRVAEEVRSDLAARGTARAEAGVAERRRIERGQPRFGIDLDETSLPAEAGLDAAPVTDRAKGCFLGQESVARVANLGHPARAVLAVRAEAPLGVGEPLLAADAVVGHVTSASGPHGLARVRWTARDAGLRASSAGDLRARSPLPEPV
jgi:folate-binding protein YgfZ